MRTRVVGLGSTIVSIAYASANVIQCDRGNMIVQRDVSRYLLELNTFVQNPLSSEEFLSDAQSDRRFGFLAKFCFRYDSPKIGTISEYSSAEAVNVDKT